MWSLRYFPFHKVFDTTDTEKALEIIRKTKYQTEDRIFMNEILQFESQ